VRDFKGDPGLITLQLRAFLQQLNRPIPIALAPPGESGLENADTFAELFRGGFLQCHRFEKLQEIGAAFYCDTPKRPKNNPAGVCLFACALRRIGTERPHTKFFAADSIRAARFTLSPIIV
jgi:hypothetical protein